MEPVWEEKVLAAYRRVGPLTEYRHRYLQLNEKGYYYEKITRGLGPHSRSWRLECFWEKGIWITSISYTAQNDESLTDATAFIYGIRNRLFAYYRELNSRAAPPGQTRAVGP